MKTYTQSLKDWQKNAFNAEFFRDINQLGMVKPGHSKAVDFTYNHSGDVEKRNEDTENYIVSTQNYDILMNGAYQWKLLYVPNWLVDRMSYIATPKYELDKSD